ncbi:MAG: class I fructose-bisphosphate aldolase [Spirochaetota bacterium]
MVTGLQLRKKAFFDSRDGRSVIIAMDHGAIVGAMPGIERPRELVGACVDAGIDGILTNKGFVDAAVEAWDRPTALVLRLTGGFTVLGGGFEEEMVVEPETALAYGASCAAITVKFGHEREGAFIKQASLAIDACHRMGLPVMVEAMAKGTLKGESFPANNADAIRMVARMGAEIGADLIKTYYTGSIDSFQKVTEECPVPIVILGGAKTDSVRDVFQDIYDSLQAGGKGIAVGRNIWGHGNVDKMLAAVNGIVHGNWSVDRACEEVGLH